jgi:multiple antibiotic resistance protein
VEEKGLMREFFEAFIMLFVVLDVIGVIPLFLGLTAQMNSAERRRVVNQSVAVSLVILIIFAFLGGHLFSFLRIEIEDFMVAGGTLLFVLSIGIIRGESKYIQTEKVMVGYVPLGTPILAGPGAITTTILVRQSYGWAITLLAIGINILLCKVCLTFATYIHKILGDTGSNVIARIMGLILAAIGVMFIRKGLMVWLG